MIVLTEQLKGLYSGYPGDVAWEKFVHSFPEINEIISQQIPLDHDMARVMYWRKNNSLEGVKEYLEYKVPAFDKYTPLEVLTLPEGRIILRSCIMRMK